MPSNCEEVRRKMDKVVYLLCAVTSGACAFLLLRGYLITKMKLLLWSTLCFIALTSTNILVYVDLIVLPEIDLLTLRNCVTFLGLSVLIFGMIRETV